MTSGLITHYILGALAIIFVSVLVYRLHPGKDKSISWKALAAFAAIGALFLPIAQLFKYETLGLYVDFAHWLGVLTSIASTGLPLSLNHEFILPGTLNYFSVHFTPLLYIVAIPFKAIPIPQTLIITNAALMLSAAIPLYLLAKHLTGKKWFAWFMIALLVWYPTFQYITLYEFEMLRFSIPIILWMINFWEIKRLGWFFLFAVLACLIREEVGLTVAMFGVYAMITDKKKWKGVVTMTIGLGAFFLITGTLMPELRGGNYAHVASGLFAAFGETPIEILTSAILHPITTLGIILDAVKIANIGMLFLPLLGLSFFSPTVLISALANVGVGLISEAEVHTSYMLYYIAPSVPFIFYAFMKGWPRAVAWVHSRFAKNRSEEASEFALARAVLAGMIVSAVVFGPSMISLQFWLEDVRPAPFRTQNYHYSAYQVTDHHRSIDEVIAFIPDDAIVTTQQFLHPRLSEKVGVMVYPDLYSRDGRYEADYALFDLTNNGLIEESPAYVSLEEMREVTQDGDWELVISNNDGYLLYVRVSDM